MILIATSVRNEEKSVYNVYVMYIESSATQNMYFRVVVALIKLLNEPLHDTASMGSCLSLHQPQPQQVVDVSFLYLSLPPVAYTISIAD